MQLLHYLSEMFHEDLGFIIPGSREKLTREIAIRLIFYAGFLFFIIRLFLPVIMNLFPEDTWPDQFSPPHAGSPYNTHKEELTPL